MQESLHVSDGKPLERCAARRFNVRASAQRVRFQGRSVIAPKLGNSDCGVKAALIESRAADVDFNGDIGGRIVSEIDLLLASDRAGVFADIEA